MSQLSPAVFLHPRPGRLGGVPHTEDAHGNGDDQVRQHVLLGQDTGVGQAMLSREAECRPGPWLPWSLSSAAS